MKQGKLSWFDRMMIGVTYAEANVEEPDLSHIKTANTSKKSHLTENKENYEPFDGETIPVR